MTRIVRDKIAQMRNHALKIDPTWSSTGSMADDWSWESKGASQFESLSFMRCFIFTIAKLCLQQHLNRVLLEVVDMLN